MAVAHLNHIASGCCYTPFSILRDTLVLTIISGPALFQLNANIDKLYAFVLFYRHLIKFKDIDIKSDSKKGNVRTYIGLPINLIA